MDRDAEIKVSYRIYLDTQFFLERKNGKPNHSLERTPMYSPITDFEIHAMFISWPIQNPNKIFGINPHNIGPMIHCGYYNQ